MFSQFRNVVEGLAQPRLSQGTTRQEDNTNPSIEHQGRSQSPAKPLTDRSAKAKLEDRLRASFTIGDVSNPSTPSPSSRVSPTPQFVNEHPLSPVVDHPLSPISIPLPVSPPPHNRDSRDHDLPFDAIYSPSDPSSPPLLNAPVNSTPVDSGTGISAASVSASSDQNSLPLPDSPAIAQPSENPIVSEEGLEMDGSTESLSPTGCPHDPVDTVSDVQSIAESTQTGGHEPEVVSVVENSSEPDHPASANVEVLQERLKSMEQQFVGRYQLIPSPNVFLKLNRRFCVVFEAAGRKYGHR